MFSRTEWIIAALEKRIAERAQKHQAQQVAEPA